MLVRSACQWLWVAPAFRDRVESSRAVVIAVVAGEHERRCTCLTAWRGPAPPPTFQDRDRAFVVYRSSFDIMEAVVLE